jgi:GalNAc-alpha-(1->4)-GalNAc-alpha-(1->3)-diNAcBac-PP-undecaprenol alpha-1,4-N-acetyl-D-galactosaminyltransferase
MRKIGLLIDNLGTGGAQKQIVLLASELCKRGYDVELYHYGTTNFWMESLNDVTVVEIKYGTLWQRSLRLRRLTKSSHREYLIAFLFIPSIIALISTFFGFFGPKLIFSERSYEDKTRLIFKLIPRIFYFNASAITANSIAQYDVLKAHWYIPSKRLRYIPNGQNMMPSNTSNHNTHRLVSIGRVSEGKGTLKVIQLIAEIVKRGFNDVRLFWVGASEDTLYSDQCTELIMRLGIEENWIWVGRTNNVGKYYENSSMLLHLSKGEGFPNVICEAMSWGLPYIATDVSDLSLVFRKEMGALVPQNASHEHLADLVIRNWNLSNNQKTDNSNIIQSTVERNFSVKKYVESYVELILNG